MCIIDFINIMFISFAEWNRISVKCFMDDYYIHGIYKIYEI